MMKKISIVVPVYNSEKYLEKTLSALKCQSYTNIEIILIDDGSTDSSLDICRRASKEDERILCYSVPNGGPSNARNIGLSKATGEYIGFCDSDDLPDADMYKTLYEYLALADADVALCDIFTERDGRAFGFPFGGDKILSGDEVARELMARMIGNTSDNDSSQPIWGSVVRCLFKREIIEKYRILFPTDIHFAEDLVFTLRYLSKAGCAAICERALYYYTCNGDSIMNSFFSYKAGMLGARRALVSYVEEIISALGLPELRARLAVTERCYYHECVGNACRRGDGRTRGDMIAEIREIVSDEAVKKAFRSFDAKNLKTRIKYALIKYRCSRLLYAYYKKRFK